MPAPTVAEVRERVATDLSDAALQDLIDSEAEAVASAAGGETTEREIVRPVGDRLVLLRPATVIQSVIEYPSWSSPPITLDPADYRLIGDRTLIRLSDGPNRASMWGEVVDVTYTPKVNGELRKRVITDLVALRVAFQGFGALRVGEWTGDQRDYEARRRALMREVEEAVA